MSCPLGCNVLMPVEALQHLMQINCHIISTEEIIFNLRQKPEAKCDDEAIHTQLFCSIVKCIRDLQNYCELIYVQHPASIQTILYWKKPTESTWTKINQFRVNALSKHITEVSMLHIGRKCQFDYTLLTACDLKMNILT